MAGKVGSMHQTIANALGRISGQREASIKAMVRNASECNGYYTAGGKKKPHTGWFTTPLPVNTMKRLDKIAKKTGTPKTSLLRGIIFATLPALEEAIKAIPAEKVVKKKIGCPFCDR